MWICGYVDASKWHTRNNIVQMKLPKFWNGVKICPSSIWIEALLFVSCWVLSHTVDNTQIVQRKTYHHYTATWLPEQIWNVILSSHMFGHQL